MKSQILRRIHVTLGFVLAEKLVGRTECPTGLGFLNSGRAFTSSFTCPVTAQWPSSIERWPSNADSRKRDLPLLFHAASFHARSLFLNPSVAGQR